MTKFEGENYHNPLNRKLAIYKVGILGSSPLDFMEELSSGIGAGYVSSDKVRKELLDKRDEVGMSPKKAQHIDMRRIQEILEKRSLSLLENDDSLVIDMFMNSIRSREFAEVIARESGSLAIALCLRTSRRVAYNRVDKWAKNDEFIIPVNRWNQHPIVAAKEMAKHVTYPTLNESPDYIIDIDGSDETQYLVDQVKESLDNIASNIAD